VGSPRSNVAAAAVSRSSHAADLEVHASRLRRESGEPHACAPIRIR
jgi:hypothetical protein